MKFKIIIFIFLLFLILISCKFCCKTTPPQNEFINGLNKVILEKIKNDKTIDNNEFIYIVSYIRNNKNISKNNNKFDSIFNVDNDYIDYSKLKKYIINLSKDSLKFPTSIQIFKNINFFADNSGSFFPYIPDSNLNDSSRIQSKLYCFLNILGKENIKNHNNFKNYYISNEIIKAQNSKNTYEYINSFINRSRFIQISNSHQTTDLPDMFDKILKNTDFNSLSFFITDGILSLHSNYNETKNLQGAESYLTGRFNVLNDSLFNKNLKLIVLGDSAFFMGNYYNCIEGKVPLNIDGKISSFYRPYYFFILGNQEIVDYFLSIYDISKNTHSFTTPLKLSQKLNSQILPQTNRIGDFRFITINNITYIDDAEYDRKGEFRFSFVVDLSYLINYYPRTYLLNKDNFYCTNNFRIDSIQSYNPRLIQGTDRPYVRNINPTHIITLSSKRSEPFSKNESIFFKMIIKIPDWITELSSENDLSMSDSRSSVERYKTFGLSYLINGINSSLNDDSNLVLIKIMFNK